MKTENLFNWEKEERERKQRREILKSFSIIPAMIIIAIIAFYFLTKI